MDVLSDILSTLKFRGTLYFTTKFSAPWGIRVPAYQNVARFHLAVGGDCWIRLAPEARPVLLSSGDMIIIPHGSAHLLSDRPDSPVEPLDDVLLKAGFTGEGHLVYGGEEQAGGSRLVCGHLEFDDNFTHPLLSELPDHILITGKQALDFSWFDQAIKFMCYEAQATNMGNAAMINRLSEILFIHAVRVWNAAVARDGGFIKALGDPGIGRSLKAFHAVPDARWTIESLASEAGLSRSLFASRFRTLMEMTPMAYVTLWRMQKACHFLLRGDMPMELIAEKVGYQSPAAFAKVFKKTIGIGPGRFRREKSVPDDCLV